MKIMLAFCLFGFGLCQNHNGENIKFSHMSVFDWMKVLTNPEIYALIAQKEVQWPTYSIIPPPSFTCSQKQFPGFYAGW